MFSIVQIQKYESGLFALLAGPSVMHAR